MRAIGKFGNLFRSDCRAGVKCSVLSRRDNYSCNDVLRVLCTADETGLLCPRLEELRLSALDFDPTLVVQLVEARWEGKGAVSISCLHLTLSHRQSALFKHCNQFFEDCFPNFQGEKLVLFLSQLDS